MIVKFNFVEVYLEKSYYSFHSFLLNRRRLFGENTNAVLSLSVLALSWKEVILES